ncbi:hypothetical protein Back11_62420 [Paenibacillus baekrokdamisoli]|uniref:Uncharacterized protein n=1 Tax=Paenibacillus baekrokdamisoli TaxID=1712516 RepID=A0A3G9J129_9BACL|nr:hypothetical protein [Paenibacillus baekrokdamisoli]MBB3069529.1 hypothetical protein [Paenibacillus baekrokdamisoli]BBH24897.1 hypothetical protein Back11_62420 [Paenibacillus baekrokdamisoli]
MNNQLKWNEIITKLQNRSPLQPLSPVRVWDQAIDEDIAALALPEGEALTPESKEVIALKAGLHLWNDSLDLSHSYSQQIEDDATGCYWHAIMHRMEHDYSNANYWFHCAGSHPVKGKLQAKVADWLQHGVILVELPESRIRETLVDMKRQSVWNPNALTDIIQLQESGKASEETRAALEYIQHLEVTELFAHTLSAVEAIR